MTNSTYQTLTINRIFGSNDNASMFISTLESDPDGFAEQCRIELENKRISDFDYDELIKLI